MTEKVVIVCAVVFLMLLQYAWTLCLPDTTFTDDVGRTYIRCSSSARYSWLDATKTCSRYEAVLPIIRNATENEALHKLLSDLEMQQTFLGGFLEDSSDHDGCQVTLNGAACYVPCHEAFSVNCNNKLARSDVSWFEAVEFCANAGSSIKPHDRMITTGSGQSTGCTADWRRSDAAWVGDRNWRWVDGTAVEFTDWLILYPGKQNEYSIITMQTNTIGGSWRTHSANATMLQQVVCEVGVTHIPREQLSTATASTNTVSAHRERTTTETTHRERTTTDEYGGERTTTRNTVTSGAVWYRKTDVSVLWTSCFLLVLF